MREGGHETRTMGGLYKLDRARKWIFLPKPLEKNATLKTHLDFSPVRFTSEI